MTVCNGRLQDVVGEINQVDGQRLQKESTSMASATVTPGYAAILAIYYAVLSAWVVLGRATFRIHHGDGGNAELNRRIRAHGNFAE
jgi:hypothetical protein